MFACKTLVKVVNGPSDPGFSGGVRVEKGGLLGPFDVCHFSGELSEIQSAVIVTFVVKFLVA